MPSWPSSAMQPVDEAARRLARGVHHHDPAGVDHRGHRRDAAFGLGLAQVHQFQRTLQDVGVRILLEGHQHVGLFDHRCAQVVVRVEFGADHHLRPDDGAHALQQVALAVVVAVGDHRAVQAEQHHVHRQRGAQVGQQLVAQRLVGGARGGAAGLRGGDHAFQQRPARRPCRAAAPPTAGRRRSSCGRGAGRPCSSRAPGTSQPGGHRREGVGLGGQGGGEDAHGCAFVRGFADAAATAWPA